MIKKEKERKSEIMQIKVYCCSCHSFHPPPLITALGFGFGESPSFTGQSGGPVNQGTPTCPGQVGEGASDTLLES